MQSAREFPNLVAMFFARAAERGDQPFLHRKVDGAWVATSWADAARTVASLAAGLTAAGLERGDRVMLVSENRPEWCLSDLAIMAAGCVTVPAYVTNTERDHLHVIENSGARAVIVSTAKLARTLLPAVVRASHAQLVIGMDEMRVAQQGVRFLDWHALVRDHPAEPEAAAARAAFGRGDLACIIYTSGTGGAPRGVRQHHGAILHNCQGCASVIEEDLGLDEPETFLSFLPLSHAYEHTGGQFLPIAMGGQIFYAEGLEKLAANMEEVRPTIMFVVPRLFEVLHGRIAKAIAAQGKLSQWLLARALEVGAREYDGRLGLKDRPVKLMVDRLLKPRIAGRFGGRMKALVSGGAPLNPEVGLFFHALGIRLLQGYGQTEAGPVISCNRPQAGIRMDTVGPPLPDTEVRIGEDGEILVRGELVMQGYWRNEAETARAIDGEGWLHTGDVGELDAAGRIRITDRKKDLIVNDKGENVAPQKVEGMLTLQPEIAQAMIAGDRRPYMVAVLVPDAEWMQQYCARDGARCDLGDLRTVPEFRAGLQAAVERVNRDLSVTERVRRFVIADEAFTVENEQMTPSLKIRRHKLREAYGERMDALYRA